MKYLVRLNIVLIFLIFSNCSVKKNRKSANESNAIKYNQLYVYDNKSDTIIKNYSLFDSLLSSLPSTIDTSNPANNFVPMPGSTFTESFMFYPKKQGTICPSYRRDKDTLIACHQRQKKTNDSNEVMTNLRVDSNQISFQQGVYNSIITKYSGKISNDSLFLFIDRRINDFKIQTYPPDTFRIYILIQTLK